MRLKQAGGFESQSVPEPDPGFPRKGQDRLPFRNPVHKEKRSNHCTLQALENIVFLLSGYSVHIVYERMHQIPNN